MKNHIGILKKNAFNLDLKIRKEDRMSKTMYSSTYVSSLWVFYIHIYQFRFYFYYIYV